jgi:hypothetical protein
MPGVSAFSIQYSAIAAGSASELEYHFLLAKDLELMTADE